MNRKGSGNPDDDLAPGAAADLALLQVHLARLGEEAARAGALASRLPERDAEIATLREEIVL